jgi:hypothetical protein
MNLHQLDKYLEHRLFVDVNDPRYSYIMKDMQEKNENFKKMLQEDSMNPLFAI